MIRVEREGPITTVILARPEVKNAVDYRTAEQGGKGPGPLRAGQQEAVL